MRRHSRTGKGHGMRRHSSVAVIGVSISVIRVLGHRRKGHGGHRSNAHRRAVCMNQGDARDNLGFSSIFEPSSWNIVCRSITLRVVLYRVEWFRWIIFQCGGKNAFPLKVGFCFAACLFPIMVDEDCRKSMMSSEEIAVEIALRRQSGLSGRADMFGINLAGATLKDHNLSNCNLSGADLCQAVLDGSVLDDSNLAGCTFDGASLQRASARRCEAAGADFTNAVLRGADLSDSNMAGADFTGADLTDACLKGTKFAAVDLDDAIMPNGETFDESKHLDLLSAEWGAEV